MAAANIRWIEPLNASIVRGDKGSVYVTVGTTDGRTPDENRLRAESEWTAVAV